MKEVKDISSVKLGEAEKVMSEYTEEEKQVVLDKLFADILNSWKRATEGCKDLKEHMLIEAGFSPQGMGINERGVLARVVTKQEGDKYSVWHFDTWQEAVEELLGKD